MLRQQTPQLKRSSRVLLDLVLSICAAAAAVTWLFVCQWQIANRDAEGDVVVAVDFRRGDID